MLGPRLVLICGLPGSGKTTLARRLAVELGAVRFCPDEWLMALELDLFDQPLRGRLEALQWELAQDLLRGGRNVVIEWGVWARWERDVVRERARELGVAVELRYLDAPIEVLWARVSDRNENGPRGTPIISRENLVDWSEHSFEAPTPAEQALFDPPTTSSSPHTD